MTIFFKCPNCRYEVIYVNVAMIIPNPMCENCGKVRMEEIKEAQEPTRTCVLCGKPMLNSWHKFCQVDPPRYMHKRCEEAIGCSNCISMIVRGIEGKCVCGNLIQLSAEGDKYRIIHGEKEISGHTEAGKDG